MASPSGLLSSMKKASITETTRRPQRLDRRPEGRLPGVDRGRGRPVARLEPVAGREDGGQDGRLSRLVRDGVLRPRRTGPPAALFSASPPRANASAVELLINEQREEAVKFWDASAIVPLLIAETTTRSLQALARRDSDMLAWWGSQVECASAVARLERAGHLDRSGAALAFDQVEAARRRVARGSTPARSCARTPCGFFAFIRFGRPMRFSLQRPSSPPNAVPRRSKSSRSRTVSPTRRGRRKGSS